MRAVILAGGRGTRLAPYTTVLPKPLMPIGDMPILELLIRCLKRYGVQRVTLAVGHLAALIMAYFNNGDGLGIPIDYSIEQEPLGTAGPLAVVEGLDQTFLAMNGDLLTDLDFDAMIAFHRRHEAVATIGLYQRDVKIDLGVIETNAAQFVTAYIEKPVFHYQVSMGVYVLEPDVLKYIPTGQRFDLPDLIRALTGAGERVVGYTHSGYWLDIGRPDDYQRAQDDFPNIRSRLLGDHAGMGSTSGGGGRNDDCSRRPRVAASPRKNSNSAKGRIG